MMAVAVMNRLMPSGYDDDFVVPPDEDLYCIICQLPSKEPVQTKCGHRFCRKCLEEYLRRKEQEGCQLTCPTDRQVLERDKDIFPDKLTERKILSLLIKCQSEGCEWNGELRAKEDHLSSCIFKAVSCKNKSCEEKFPRKDLTEHVATKCQWRIVKCVYCVEHHPQCQMENHLETCEGFLTACPNKCGTRIASEMIRNHVENSCPLTKVPCPYTWIGCNTEIRREELVSHLQCETRHHLELACCKLNNIQDEVKEKKNSLEEKVTSIQRQHQNKISNLQNQLEEREKDLKNQLEERVKIHENRLEERVKNLENQVEKIVNTQIGEINQRLNQNNNKVKNEVNTVRWALFFCFAVVFVIAGVLQNQLEKKVGEAQERFEEKSNGIQSQVDKKVDEFYNNLQNQLGKKIDDVMMLINAAQPYIFTWKIKGFENIRTQAKNGRQVTVESDPFYMYGYKLRLELWPNGYEDGLNTHLSLFIIVMKGENDAILAWPIQMKLMFTLIDQQENQAERKNVISEFLTSHPDAVNNFAKPITNENHGRGRFKFVSHEKLRTRRFLIDDVIFIQVQVGLSSPPSWL